MRNTSRLIAVVTAIAALACARTHRTTPLPGQYVRSSVQLIEGGRVLPTPTDGPFVATFPSNVQIDNAGGFEVQAGEGQLTGKYRMEHDSIFFDQGTVGEMRVAFAGRVLDDTLDLQWLPIGAGGAASASEVRLRFVRAK